ncbi:MAG: NAD-dependent epimerase/dehydratase family protein [Planctomycetota bacterium]|nr:NAD-dependent epimerase/dehydratase family protein [Planctomycetota bacterium]
MRVLVTGGGGFLGQYIVEQLLQRGDTVRSISRNRYGALDKLGVQQIEGDLRDQERLDQACEDIDVVFHVAAIAGIWGPWEDFYGINTQGTLNLIESCRKKRVSKLVYSSSPSVIFDGTDQQGIDESVRYPEKWLCHYQQTKAYAEQAVLESNSEALLTCSLRPHLIWGPRDQHLIPRLIDRARSGKLRIVGDGANLVDNVYVENAAAAHLQAAAALSPRSPVCGQAYFISQGEPVNCWEWINEILERTGTPIVTRKISYQVAWSLGLALEGVYKLLGWQSEPRMTRFLAAQLARHHYYKVDKAKKDFGYEPVISHKEGMTRLIASLKGK